MKFLVDICVGKAVAEMLLNNGYDTKLVSELDPCMNDEDILDLAGRERRILITLDKDFGKLIYLIGHTHCGMIRLPNIPGKERVATVEKVLIRYAGELETGAIITVKSEKIRITKRKG